MASKDELYRLDFHGYGVPIDPNSAPGCDERALQLVECDAVAFVLSEAEGILWVNKDPEEDWPTYAARFKGVYDEVLGRTVQ